ncbi:MAG: GtrA family protein [Desulfobulbus sp.]|jgi:putative flippase GtrA|uniref:GtrA family protein n=1 Tax=Desulfobulbus sp. TaxID=895 RepID=UPI00283D2A6C|nr:GtrA family protein [Desulfobulbus sp.]
MTKTSQQVFRYLIIGISAVILDAITYSALLKIFDVSIIFAKLSGVLASVAYGYALNSRWTFSSKTSLRTIVTYCVVYGISIIQNVATNNFFVKNLPECLFPLTSAFLIATAVSVCINFLGMKFWVFKKNAQP